MYGEFPNEANVRLASEKKEELRERNALYAWTRTELAKFAADLELKTLGIIVRSKPNIVPYTYFCDERFLRESLPVTERDIVIDFLQDLGIL